MNFQHKMYVMDLASQVASRNENMRSSTTSHSPPLFLVNPNGNLITP